MRRLCRMIPQAGKTGAPASDRSCRLLRGVGGSRFAADSTENVKEHSTDKPSVALPDENSQRIFGLPQGRGFPL